MICTCSPAGDLWPADDHCTCTPAVDLCRSIDHMRLIVDYQQGRGDGDGDGDVFSEEIMESGTDIFCDARIVL